jgi:hypothetical protein
LKTRFCQVIPTEEEAAPDEEEEAGDEMKL